MSVLDTPGSSTSKVIGLADTEQAVSMVGLTFMLQVLVKACTPGAKDVAINVKMEEIARPVMWIFIIFTLSIKFSKVMLVIY